MWRKVIVHFVPEHLVSLFIFYEKKDVVDMYIRTHDVCNFKCTD